MKRPDDTVFLYHVFDACQNIIAILDKISFAELLADKEKQSAVLWNFHVMGEATKNISAATLSEYPEVEWTSIARFRDKIVHHYFGIDFDIVWNVAKEKLPGILAELKHIPELTQALHKMDIEK